MKRKRITEFIQIIKPNSAMPLFNTVYHDGVFCKCGAILIFDGEEGEPYIVQCPLCGFEIMYR